MKPYRSLFFRKGHMVDIILFMEQARAKKTAQPEFHQSVEEYAEEFGCEYKEGSRPWYVPSNVALSSSTQNENSGDEDRVHEKNIGIRFSEDASMPNLPDTVVYHEIKNLFGPGKAANAGGRWLEMPQNAMRLGRSRKEVDNELRGSMVSIHNQCVKYREDGGYVHYAKGANIAGFINEADSMLEQGLV